MKNKTKHTQAHSKKKQRQKTKKKKKNENKQNELTNKQVKHPSSLVWRQGIFFYWIGKQNKKRKSEKHEVMYVWEVKWWKKMKEIKDR